MSSAGKAKRQAAPRWPKTWTRPRRASGRLLPVAAALAPAADGPPPGVSLDEHDNDSVRRVYLTGQMTQVLAAGV